MVFVARKSDSNSIDCSFVIFYASPWLAWAPCALHLPSYGPATKAKKEATTINSSRSIKAKFSQRIIDDISMSLSSSFPFVRIPNLSSGEHVNQSIPGTPQGCQVVCHASDKCAELAAPLAGQHWRRSCSCNCVFAGPRDK